MNASGSKIALLIFIALATLSHAQVVNNAIDARISLTIDGPPVLSSTDKSTVEWSCINKKVTSNCLIYHNDQWFTATPHQSGTFFLNISNQKCRDQKGVQVVILKGNPCERESYELIQCESFTNQSDTFITLDSLKASITYLINIDGFLADICSFQLELSTKPKGLPTKKNSLLSNFSSLKRDGHIVQLEWSVTSQLADSINGFEVYRMHSLAKSYHILASIPVLANSQGRLSGTFQFTDTLKQYGKYSYKVICIEPEGKERSLLIEKTTEYNEQIFSKHCIAKVPINFQKRGDVDIIIINAATDAVLGRRTCYNCNSSTIDVNLDQEVNKGIYRFWIKVIHSKTKQVQQFVFLVDEKGELVKR